MNYLLCKKWRCLDELIKSPNGFDFIVRAIIGCTYKSTVREGKDEREVKNALIRMLNSSLIDVDKLDYILRDSVLSGYRNVEMDLPRLTSSIILSRKRDSSGIWPMYKHSAQSVIENVFTARNNELRWIISHNAVVYEAEILKSCILKITGMLNIKPSDIFSYESITGKGKEIKSDKLKLKCRYLGDEDIICLLKIFYGEVPEVKEYFDRNLRKKAIWKTHSEYVALFHGEIDEIYKAFSYFLKEGADNGEALNVINASSHSEKMKGLGKENCEKYKMFFNCIGFDFSDASNEGEIAFVRYDAYKFSRKIDGDNVFLLYHDSEGGYKTLNEVVRFSKNESSISDVDSDVQQGFFVYYKPRDKNIDGITFREQYHDLIVGRRADTPK